MRTLPQFEMPSFSDAENVFLHHYAQSGDRVQAMHHAGLVQASDTRDTAALAAAQIISKAELMPISVLCAALGADKIAVLAQIWELARNAEPKEAIKALFILARVHAMLAEKSPSKAVSLILHPPEGKKPNTPTGLPFTLEKQPEGKA